MLFCEVLDSYIREIGCTNKEIAKLCGISPESIGRYRKGSRTPSDIKGTVSSVAAGLAAAAKSRGIRLNREEIERSLSDTLPKKGDADYGEFYNNLKKLVSALELTNAELAKNMGYDPSYISRVLSGKRRIADVEKFISDFSAYVSLRYRGGSRAALIAQAMGYREKDFKDKDELSDALSTFLGLRLPEKKDEQIRELLSDINAFDLGEYNRSVSAEKPRTSGLTFRFSSSRRYYGIKERMNGEIDFIKATVLSRSMEDVTVFSNMPGEEADINEDTEKRIWAGIRMMINKGLRLNIIHNIRRPEEEVLRELRRYIPLYMTGRISPFYLPGEADSDLLSALKVSGAAALSGEAVAGHCRDCRYYLTDNREEMRYYNKKAAQLLGRSRPLMMVYNRTRSVEFGKALEALTENGVRRMICSSLPLFTASGELLERVFSHNRLPESVRRKIYILAGESKKRFSRILSETGIRLEAPFPERKDFDAHRLSLSVQDIFYEKEILYSYEEYTEHLRLTKEFLSRYPGCSIRLSSEPAFDNISIISLADDKVLISKNRSPAIHFAICLPGLAKAVSDISVS